MKLGFLFFIWQSFSLILYSIRSSFSLKPMNFFQFMFQSGAWDYALLVKENITHVISLLYLSNSLYVSQSKKENYALDLKNDHRIINTSLVSSSATLLIVQD